MTSRDTDAQNLWEGSKNSRFNTVLLVFYALIFFTDLFFCLVLIKYIYSVMLKKKNPLWTTWTEHIKK